MPTLKWSRGGWRRPLTVALDASGTHVEWSFEKPARRVLKRIPGRRAQLPTAVSRSGQVGFGSTYRAGLPVSRVLDDLLRLADADVKPSDVVDFVLKWGVLGENGGEGTHPVKKYVDCAKQIGEVFAAAKNAGQSKRAQKSAVEAATWLLLEFSDAVDLHSRWFFDRGSELVLTASTLRGGLFTAIAERLDSTARIFSCDACGKRHTRPRRPPGGGVAYCDHCRKLGVPRQRARAEYRRRRARDAEN